MKTLSNLADRRSLSLRIAQLSPADTARWGVMSVHQMICHVDDAFKVPLGEKFTSPATGILQRTLFKWAALHLPTRWPKGVRTRPEVEQGRGGSLPIEFRQDLAALLSTLDRFCCGMEKSLVPHSIFGEMTEADWMRWGYLHTDHHLRQFGR